MVVAFPGWVDFDLVCLAIASHFCPTPISPSRIGQTVEHQNEILVLLNWVCDHHGHPIQLCKFNLTSPHISIDITCMLNNHPAENEVDECFLGSVMALDDSGSGAGGNEAAMRVGGLGGGGGGGELPDREE